jgi:hypothetical protein
LGNFEFGSVWRFRTQGMDEQIERNEQHLEWHHHRAQDKEKSQIFAWKRELGKAVTRQGTEE